MIKTLHTNIALNDSYDTRLCLLGCVRPKQFSVVQTIHRIVGLKCFSFSSTKMFVIIVIDVYFIYISQGSVEMHL